nr:anti-sigma regulatory factor [Alienimonas californiensis]
MTQTDERAVQSQNDVVLIRQIVREWAREVGFGLVDQTKIITAASELARNAVLHGGGGVVRLESLEKGAPGGPVRRGLRLTFEDEGPGIPDVEQALTDGYTSGGGMGLGLGGSRRLVNEFEIQSTVGEGTRIIVTRWK